VWAGTAECASTHTSGAAIDPNMTTVPQTARYALRAMSCLAAHPPGEKVPADVIAAATHVPPAFLSKVLRKLVGAGLLTAERGHHGGFALARPPEVIRFLDILDAVDVDVIEQDCAFGWGQCNASRPCPLHPAWVEFKQGILTWAATHTLADVDCASVLDGVDREPSAPRRSG
jgi:Rrf2 family protein